MKKVLRAYQIIKQDGMSVISSTYHELDDNGNIERKNVKDSFYVTDSELQNHLTAVEDYINKIRFTQEV